MAHLTMALMGPFDVALDGKRVTGFQSDKARALLAYLAVEAASPHARHMLAGLLWPDVPDAHALPSLSQALCNLRTILHDHATPAPCFLITPHTIQFDPHCDHWVDVAEFGRLVDWGTGRLVDWDAAAAGKLVRRSADHSTNGAGSLAGRSAPAGHALAGRRRPAQRGPRAVQPLPPVAGRGVGRPAGRGDDAVVRADQGRRVGLSPKFCAKFRGDQTSP